MKISANGISMNYTFDGPADAPVVTMSHSLATDRGMWDPTVPALASVHLARSAPRTQSCTLHPAPCTQHPLVRVLVFSDESHSAWFA